MKNKAISAIFLSICISACVSSDPIEEVPERAQATEARGQRGQLGKADAPGSCEVGTQEFCGQQSADGCWCDAECVRFGDCCSDRDDVCAVAPEPEPEPTPDGLCPEGAVYRVTLNTNWNGSGLSNPHWSPLIGGTHNEELVLWTQGGIATSGVEQMAETGGTSGHRAEVQNAIANGLAGQVLQAAGGIPTASGSRSIDFAADPNFPQVTLASMLAPSPDWFLGVSNLTLCGENGQWLQGTVSLNMLDAGTDSGQSLEAADADTSPQAPIGLLFDREINLGSMTFELQ